MNFVHKTPTIKKKRRSLKSVFGGSELGSRLSDPEYLAKLAPPPLDTEKAIAAKKSKAPHQAAKRP